MSETEQLKELYALAESMPVRMAGLYRTDPINFGWGWLDSDEDNYGLVSQEADQKAAGTSYV